MACVDEMKKERNERINRGETNVGRSIVGVRRAAR